MKLKHIIQIVVSFLFVFLYMFFKLKNLDATTNDLINLALNFVSAGFGFYLGWTIEKIRKDLKNLGDESE